MSLPIINQKTLSKQTASVQGAPSNRAPNNNEVVPKELQKRAVSIPYAAIKPLVEEYAKVCSPKKYQAIKTLLLAMKRTNITKFLALTMISQMIPKAFVIAYLIKNTPKDKLETVLKANKIDVTPEFDVIDQMRDGAYAEGISAEDGVKYFKLQYGDTRLEQLINLVSEFGKLPSEIMNDKKIEKKLVNQGFINTWDEIEACDPAQTNMLELFRKNLHRLPRNIGKLINLEDLHLGYNQLTSLPPEIRKLTKLENLGLNSNPKICPSGQNMKAVSRKAVIELINSVLVNQK